MNKSVNSLMFEGGPKVNHFRWMRIVNVPNDEKSVKLAFDTNGINDSKARVGKEFDNSGTFGKIHLKTEKDPFVLCYADDNGEIRKINTKHISVQVNGETETSDLVEGLLVLGWLTECNSQYSGGKKNQDDLFFDEDQNFKNSVKEMGMDLTIEQDTVGYSSIRQAIKEESWEEYIGDVNDFVDYCKMESIKNNLDGRFRYTDLFRICEDFGGFSENALANFVSDIFNY